MSNKRKDTYVKAPVWRKHLRKEWKRVYHGRERCACKQRMLQEPSDP